ncbi:MAG: rod shape-determining protein MreD [Phycisphaerales bacterium]|nr:rod shape-determining protein MreD [Phycisphaerales bacterium]
MAKVSVGRAFTGLTTLAGKILETGYEMRWIAFAILLYLVTVLQTTVAPFIALHTIRPDFMVILAVYYALLARQQDAPLACWCIGLAVDLTTISYTDYANVGVHAFSLGFIGLIVCKVRELTFRESALTQLIFSFLAKLILASLVGLHMLYVMGEWDRLGETVVTAVWGAVYTAVLAPYGHWILCRLRTVLGVGVPQRLPVR